MPKRIYVGNLPSGATSRDVQGLFQQYGAVQSVKLADGGGYVEFSKDSDAAKAIDALNNQKFRGNTLTVRQG